MCTIMSKTVSTAPPPVPERFICPISLSPMKEPTIVEHNGHAYWFEGRCLSLHAHTAHADRNPVTNEPGFAAAPRILDTELQKEIRASQWAGDIEDECFAGLEEADLTHEEDIVPDGNGFFSDIVFVVDVAPELVSLPRPWATTISRAFTSVLDAWEEDSVANRVV